MKKLAACVALCGVLIGCDTKPCTPRFYELGEDVLIHKVIPAIVIHRIRFNSCSYGYHVLLNGTTNDYFPQKYVFPKNEDRK